MTLLISSLGTVSAQQPQATTELTQELVAARIQTLRDSGSQQGAGSTIDSYEAVLNAAEPAADVIFSKFGNSALNLTARCFFTEVSQRGFLLSDLHMRINDAFNEAGIVIAFPQLDVHLDRGVGELFSSQAAPATT